MNKIFEIGSNETANDDARLLLEWSSDHCCYSIIAKESNRVLLLRYYGFDLTEQEETMMRIAEDLQMLHFSKIVLSPSLSTSLLTPSRFAAEAKLSLDGIYNELNQTYFTDAIDEWQLVNAWSLSTKTYNTLKAALPDANYVHGYTTALKIYNGFSAEDQVCVHFTPHQFMVLVKKGALLQLAQTYQYKSPLDVVYYLLKICSGLGLQQSEMYLVLSGLIEEDSAMFKELRHYFLNLHFAQPPLLQLPENEYPQHYFSSVYNLAACAL